MSKKKKQIRIINDIRHSCDRGGPREISREKAYRGKPVNLNTRKGMKTTKKHWIEDQYNTHYQVSRYSKYTNLLISRGRSW